MDRKGKARKPPSHVRPSKNRPRKRCAAIAKGTGKPCRRWAMPNGRCMMHGGKSRRGQDHPSFKTGLHSRYFADTLKDVLDAEPAIGQDLAQADLQGVDDEIRLVMAMLMLHMKRRPASSERITPDWIRGAVSLTDELPCGGEAWGAARPSAPPSSVSTQKFQKFKPYP